jgi:hypothetical protein
MRSVKHIQTLAPQPKRSPFREQHAKLGPLATLDIREEIWWSRRVASGSDWMEEWISKPGRR